MINNKEKRERPEEGWIKYEVVKEGKGGEKKRRGEKRK